MPSPGEIYTASWGRYRFLRAAGEHFELEDLDRRGAFVRPLVDTFAESYTLLEGIDVQPQVVAPRSAAPPVREATPPGPAGVVEAGLFATARPEWERPDDALGTGRVYVLPRRAVVDVEVAHDEHGRPWWDCHLGFELGVQHGEIGTERTLGAVRPARGYVSRPDAELLWWQPCMTRAVEGDAGGPHCYFVTSNQRPSFHCPCRAAPAAAAIAAPPPADPPAPDLGPEPAPAEISNPAVEIIEDFTAPAGAPWGSSPPIWDVVGRTNAIGRAFYEHWSERAAIREFMGGQPRAFAEWAAYQETMQQDAHGVGGVR